MNEKENILEKQSWSKNFEEKAINSQSGKLISRMPNIENLNKIFCELVQQSIQETNGEKRK